MGGVDTRTGGSSSLQHTQWLALSRYCPMFGKRQRSIPADGSPGKRLKANIVDLYAKGTIPAARCGSLLNDAGGACRVMSCQVSHPTGRARDLQKGLASSNGWPPLYICEAVSTAPVAFLLPHEVLWHLLQHGSYECITSREGQHKLGGISQPQPRPPPHKITSRYLTSKSMTTATMLSNPMSMPTQPLKT